jgi:DNA-binding protein H-NS
LTDDGKPARKPRKNKAKNTGPKSAPQFANPADKSQTWTGKGRQPNWFRQAVEKGTNPEKMRI